MLIYSDLGWIKMRSIQHAFAPTWMGLFRGALRSSFPSFFLSLPVRVRNTLDNGPLGCLVLPPPYLRQGLARVVRVSLILFLWEKMIIGVEMGAGARAFFRIFRTMIHEGISASFSLASSPFFMSYVSVLTDVSF